MTMTVQKKKKQKMQGPTYGNEGENEDNHEKNGIVTL